MQKKFCAKYWSQRLQSFVLALRLFGSKILYEKFVRKMLIKLTPIIDFTDIFCRAFRGKDPKSAKKTGALYLQYLQAEISNRYLALLWSQKMMVKSTLSEKNSRVRQEKSISSNSIFDFEFF
jgi:hypothetical protein